MENYNTMDLNEFLSARPENLAKEQEEALAKAAAEKLDQISSWLLTGHYSIIRSELQFSPAGDETGADNDYIDFTDLHESLEDIGDVLNKLQELKEISNHES